MTELVGIDNIKLIIPFPVELGNIADKIGQENSKNWKKWLELVSIWEETIDLLKVKWGNVSKEFADFSSAERIEVENMIREKLKLHDVVLEGVIEESLGIVSELSSLIMRSIELSRKIQALKVVE